MEETDDRSGVGRDEKEAEHRKRIAEEAGHDNSGSTGDGNTLATLHSGEHEEEEIAFERSVPTGGGGVSADYASQSTARPEESMAPAYQADPMGGHDRTSSDEDAESINIDGGEERPLEARADESKDEQNGGDAVQEDQGDAPSSANSVAFDEGPARIAAADEKPPVQTEAQQGEEAIISPPGGEPATEEDTHSNDGPNSETISITETTEDVTLAEPHPLANAAIQENVMGAVVGSVAPEGGDPATGYSTEDPRFEIVDGKLKIRDDVSLDHEMTDAISVEVTVTEPSGSVRTETHDIDVLDVNEAPTTMTFDAEAMGHSETATLTVRLGGEAYQGNPRYEIFVDGEKVAAGEVDWAHPNTRVAHEDTDWRNVTIDLPRPVGGFGEVEVRYPNDRYDGHHTRDRNLLVDRIELDGHIIEAEDPSVVYEGGRGNNERMSWRGAKVFDTSGITPDPLPSVAENVDGAVIGQFDIADPDMGETFTYTVSDARFEVVDGTLKLLDGVSLDHEETATLDLQIEATDSGGHVIAHEIQLLVADQNEAPHDLSLDETSVFEAERGAVVGRVNIVDEDSAALVWDVSDDRFEVIDGEVRLKSDAVLDHESEPSIDLRLTATDSGGLSTTETFAIDVQDVVGTARPVQVSTGFRVDYFDYDDWKNDTTEVDWSATPDHRTVQSSIDFELTDGSFWDGGTNDHFAVRVTGKIEVDADGIYDFRTESDDGTRVFINGQEIVSNDGDHGMRIRAGSIELEPGLHTVEVQYFENRGVAGMNFEMRGPGEDGWSLVESQEGLSTSQGEALPVGIDFGEIGDLHSSSLHGLPHGSVLMDESNALISDGTPVDLSGWNVGGLEIVPPSDFAGTLEVTLRANGTDPEGQPFESVEALSIEVVSDPEAADAREDDTDRSDDRGGNWVESVDQSEDGSGADDQDISSDPPPSETGEEQMQAYDRMEM